MNDARRAKKLAADMIDHPMPYVQWPIEHPTDKAPCVVCDLRPVVLYSTLHRQVGACGRCRAPYEFRDSDGLVHEAFLSAIGQADLAIARAAWAVGISIEFPPFVDEPITPFVKYVDAWRKEHPARPHAGQAAVECWVVHGTGDDAHWELVGHEGVEHGSLEIAPEELPPGSTVTIVRAQAGE